VARGLRRDALASWAVGRGPWAVVIQVAPGRGIRGALSIVRVAWCVRRDSWCVVRALRRLIRAPWRVVHGACAVVRVWGAESR
jgi:hypothetical protein